MARAKIYDWDTLRKAFVSGDMDLVSLACETTKLDSSPAYISLKKRAAKEGWTELRKAYQRNTVIQAAATPRVADVAAKAEQIIDAAEMFVRHQKLARSMQGIAASMLPRIQKALVVTDLNDMDASDLTGMLRQLTTVVVQATEVERKALGLADPNGKTELNIKIEQELERTLEALESKLPPSIFTTVLEAIASLE